MKLNLGAPKTSDKSYHEEANEHAMVNLTIHIESFPDVKMSVSSGETVAQVKKRISDSNNLLTYSSLTLMFGTTKVMVFDEVVVFFF